MTSSDISLTALNIDTDFVKQAKGMGLETLGDIMDMKLPDLRKKKASTISGMLLYWRYWKSKDFLTSLSAGSYESL